MLPKYTATKSVSKNYTDVRITNLDREMFKDESWKPIYFGVKRSKSRVNNMPMSVFIQNAIMLLDAYESHAGFSLQQCPAAQAMLATPAFPLHHFPAADVAAMRH